VTGVVQGVGFRPFVYRIASGLGLSGFVGNDSAAVFVEVQGPPAALDEFAHQLETQAPPLATITSVQCRELPLAEETGFHIVESREADTGRTPIPPDVAVCADCVRELFDPTDRRYRHPFVTCTNCGPRFTIIKDLPYDRPATTMAGFPMCQRCAAEYHDPGDRRFHAQPVACPDCGPSLWFETSPGGDRISDTDAAIAAAQRALAAGRIVAIKGIGGYHLACAAGDAAAVAHLRTRKARGGKPFAVMVRDLDAARRLVEIDDLAARVMTSPARPVTLLPRVPGAPVADEVAPGNPLLGVFLPYSPVHHLLFAPVPGHTAPVPDVIVLTSANLSDEPICYTDDDAATRLPRLADAVLNHDRPIHVPCDDSVVRVVDGRELPIRRSRGYAPLPVALGREVAPVLAVGGELKNTFCLTVGDRAYLSAHVGDMGSWETMQAFERGVSQLSALADAAPARVAADLHPGYLTRSWAERRAGGPGEPPLELVQHHHAHVAALLAEHGRLGEPIVGIAFDGTGYGTDGGVWGGEVLRLGTDTRRFTRAGRLAAVPLVGGDAAVRQPWRTALAHLHAADVAWAADLPPVAAAGDAGTALVESLLRAGRGAVCTSVGRLFDAVASILDVRHEVFYEGQAAIELELLATGEPAQLPSFAIAPADSGEVVLDPAPVIAGIVAARRAGVPDAALAMAFHHAVADAVVAVTDRVADGIRLVGLTGGVFQNVLLLRLARDRLTAAGYEVLTHRVVPPNDGGLALGQAVIAALSPAEELGSA